MPPPASSGKDDEELYRYYRCLGGGFMDGGNVRIKLGTVAQPIHLEQGTRHIHKYKLVNPGGGASPFYAYQGVQK